MGSSKGTQQSDWLLHRPVCQGVQRLDLGQSQASQEHQVCRQPNEKNNTHCIVEKSVFLWLLVIVRYSTQDFFFRFVVSGLTTGETYVFRVQAINELGLSDESQESAPLTVKAALSQY